MILSLIFRVLSAAVSIYMLVCLARVFMTWVPGAGSGRPAEILAALVDPYFAWFRRFSFLRKGPVDFSPVAALSVLAVLNNALTTVAFTGRISLGIVLGMILSAFWSAIAFVLLFLAVAALVRLLAYAARWNSLHPIFRVLDALLNPVLYRVNRLVYRDRIVNYLQGLLTGIALLGLLWLGGGALVEFLVRLLARLPV